MTKWTCIKCNETTLSETATKAPKFCSNCGHNELVKMDEYRKQQKFEESKREITEVGMKMNQLYEELNPLREKYLKLVTYFRLQKTSGSISKKEYDQIVGVFKYSRGKNEDLPEV